MTKDEFLKKVTNLRIGGSYNYERSAGFDDCKKQVIEMIAELDIEGLTPETFNMFRETMEAMANRYQALAASVEESTEPIKTLSIHEKFNIHLQQTAVSDAVRTTPRVDRAMALPATFFAACHFVLKPP